MELSWLSISLFFTLLSPAILAILAFRLLYSKARFVQVNNFYLLLPALIFSTFINIDLLIIFWISIVKFYLVFKLDALIALSNCLTILNELNINLIFPWTLFRFITSPLTSNYNILAIILALHLRAGFMMLTLWGIHKTTEGISDHLELKRINSRKNTTSKRSEDTSGQSGKLLRRISSSILHPWADITNFNPAIEILMADILTEDDNLYMGRFRAFTPDGNKVSSVSLHHIFRYHPTRHEVVTNESDTKKLKSSKHRQSLIRNFGELVIPYSKIKTIHIWNFKIGSDLRINVSDKNSEEKFKWYLSLLNDTPHIFRLLEVFVFYESYSRVKGFKSRLDSWHNRNDIRIPEGKVDIYISESASINPENQMEMFDEEN